MHRKTNINGIFSHKIAKTVNRKNCVTGMKNTVEVKTENSIIFNIIRNH